MKRITIFLTLVLLFAQCSIEDAENISLDDNELDVAVPLFSGAFSLSDFTDNDQSDNLSLSVNEDQEVTLTYLGDVIRETTATAFPAIPFFIPLETEDFTVPIQFTDQTITRAEFRNSNVVFIDTLANPEPLTVEIEVPEMMKDGETFKTTITIPASNTERLFLSDRISVSGWTLQSDENSITVRHQAFDPDGQKVTLTRPTLFFDALDFKYVEGFLGTDVFEIRGDFITIGLFNNWVSGGVFFDDPKVVLEVDNAFGFPVLGVVNSLQIVNTAGEVVDLESEFVDNGISFNYPALDERGEVKSTLFEFDKTNSNLQTLFNERVTQVIYDFDALANPPGLPQEIGFVDENGFFNINVKVELPLLGKLNDLVLQDTLDLDLDQDLRDPEFRTFITNDFPTDIAIQAYFLDDEGGRIDSLFSTPFTIPAAELNAENRTETASEASRNEAFLDGRFEEIKGSQQMLFTLKLSTVETTEESLWFYEDYEVGFKLGARGKVKI